MTEKTDIDMVLVESSNIHSVGYDEDKGELLVRFRSGTLYRYQDVPRSVYQGMIEAASVGKFLGQSVKGVYDFEKIE